MVSHLPILILGIFLNLGIGAIAYRKKALRLPDGYIAAAVTGYVIFIFQPVLWILLLLFFISSTFLTKYKEGSDVKQRAMAYAEKGGERDWMQVIANGGNALFASLLGILILGINIRQLDHLIVVFIAASFASSAADTWATEVGTTSKLEPVWIFNLRKRVPRGTSGGVSIRGFIGTFFGSLIIGLTFVIASTLMYSNEVNNNILIKILFVITLGGILGSLIDTILGATWQATYTCPSCSKITEKSFHHQQSPIKTKHYTGLKFLNNDAVNFVSGTLSSLVAIGLFVLL